MFDTFDVLVPELRTFASAEIRQRRTTVGLDEIKRLFVQGIALGRIIRADAAYSNVVAWTGAPDRAGWTALVLSQDANAAADDDVAWPGYLNALRTLLTEHSTWRVTCESDCEQHPVQMLELGVDALVNLLDSYRTSGYFPIAFCVEFPAT